MERGRNIHDVEAVMSVWFCLLIFILVVLRVSLDASGRGYMAAQHKFFSKPISDSGFQKENKTTRRNNETN